ncbi:MFS transporter [Piscinibacter sp.]|uniref:MFS transporter n=1 Tax=Piscinibacter sp. TaxID=1903157 RepID=UPI002B817DDF|nr:MFS transporter [Albitalea sp.]HUG25101.1 MFS transporter [Albitalea sp.]
MTDGAGTEPHRPLWRVVFALGLTQIIAWGSLHYSIAVLAPDMATALGVSVPLVLGCFTGALAMSGFAAPAAGRWIDRAGGRRPMAAGSVLAALALVLIATAQHPAVFLAGWLLAGAAMSATLYDAAFATLSLVSGERHRQAVTALTLFGGLASTAFWPLSFALNETIGWRATIVVYAALHLLVCLPLHAWLLPSRPRSAAAPAATARPPLRKVPWRGGLAWLAASFAFGAVVFSALSVHLIVILQAQGLSAADAVLVSVLVGPMQVAGRIVEFAGGRRLRAVTTGLVAMLVMLVSLVLLWSLSGAGWLAFAFAALYGASNGVMTIVRGTVPAELHGRDGYGSLLGRLAGPAFIGKAAAPVAFALVATELGYGAGIVGLMALAAAAIWTYGVAVRRAAGVSVSSAPADSRTFG